VLFFLLIETLIGRECWFSVNVVPKIIADHCLHFKNIIDSTIFFFQLHVAQFMPVLKQYDNRSEWLDTLHLTVCS